MKVIEDDDLGFAIKQEMQNAGSPIMLKSQLKSTENRYEKLIDEMQAAGCTIEEINTALKRLSDRL
ncbi:MAG: hypothetical protein SFV81_00790 [Pirellulaceae bacterium]|nr:hypothetical protein [Pirellulaceae bacterium]